jgi:hypothetical protein
MAISQGLTASPQVRHQSRSGWGDAPSPRQHSVSLVSPVSQVCSLPRPSIDGKAYADSLVLVVTSDNTPNSEAVPRRLG